MAASCGRKEARAERPGASNDISALAGAFSYPIGMVYYPAIPTNTEFDAESRYGVE